MIVGIDAGGTNVDAVLVGDDVVASAKVPGDAPDPIERVLDGLLDSPAEVERVVVATTLVLNAAVERRLPACTNVIVPGPGLRPERAFFGEENHVADGCVDPRGRLLEDAAYDHEPAEPVVAVTAKFGTRNPELEHVLRERIDREDRRIALGSAAGPGQPFPRRAATAVANAKAKPTFDEFAAEVEGALDSVGAEAPVYYLKGDAGMLGTTAMTRAPSHVIRSGPAASALGLVALTGVEAAVCVDIGGTTTDVVPVTGGFPATERVETGELQTGYRGVRTQDLPLGGDTRIAADGLTGRRQGNAAAFGGDAPTLTDALAVVGTLDDDWPGDATAARAAFDRFDDPLGVAEHAVQAYIDRVAEAIGELAPDSTRLVVGGVLAPQFADDIAESVANLDTAVVPDHAPVAGAVGCAAARVSVETRIHVDSARGTLTTSSIGTGTGSVDRGRTFDAAEVEALVTERAREAAREAGATDDDMPVSILDRRRFNVVEQARVVGQVVDATAQVEPGLRRLGRRES